MRDPVLLVEILSACKQAKVIPDRTEGFTEVSPSVIMFYGVKLGTYRQRRYLAVIYPNKIVIESYGNQSKK